MIPFELAIECKFKTKDGFKEALAIITEASEIYKSEAGLEFRVDVMTKSSTEEKGQPEVFYIICQCVVRENVNPSSWALTHDTFHFIASLSGSSQRQQLTLAILQNHVTQCSSKFFNNSSSILSQLQHRYNHLHIFPLHIESERLHLVSSSVLSICIKDKWKGVFEYLGPQIAMYFGWMNFFITYLAIASIFGLILTFAFYSSAVSIILYTIALTILWSIFLPAWNRRQVTLEYEWKYKGVMTELDEKPNPRFRKQEMTDSLTKDKIYYYPSWKRYVTIIFVTIPVSLLMCCLVLLYVTSLNNLVDYLEKQECSDNIILCTLISQGPGVLNAIAIALIDALYHIVATFLTNLENYPTESAVQNALMSKLMPFFIINTHASLWYASFVLQDQAKLVSRVYNLLLLSQLSDNVLEVLVPSIVATCCNFRIKHQALTSPTSRRKSLLDQVRSQQLRSASYRNPFEDYKRVLLTFSLVAWYAPVIPVAPVLALLSLSFEIRCDALKLLGSRGNQRPWAANTHGIEKFENWIQVIIITAIVMNALVLDIFVLQEDEKRIVLIEHGLLLLHGIIRWCIPSTPNWIVAEKRAKKLAAHHDDLKKYY